MKKDKIVREISNYIKYKGGSPDEWHVGIAKIAENRLFIDYKVDREKGEWIWRTADTPPDAREIERYFLEVLHTGRAPKGDNRTARQVYAYKKSRGISS